MSTNVMSDYINQLRQTTKEEEYNQRSRKKNTINDQGKRIQSTIKRHWSPNRRFLINQFPNEWQRFVNSENDGWGSRERSNIIDLSLKKKKDLINEYTL